MKKTLCTAALSVFVSILAFAQEKDININVSGGKSTAWYATPWVWVVGAAVFILLLVALTRGSGRRD